MFENVIFLSSNTQVFGSIFTTRMFRFAEERFAIEKMAAQDMSIKIAEAVFFRVAQTWQTDSCRSKTQRKNTSSMRHLTLHGTLQQTQTAPQTQTTPAFPKWVPLPEPQTGPRANFSFTKIPKWAPQLSFFLFLSVPQVVENTV